MISDLSDKIEIVEEASPEIEKVINCFNKKNHKGINDHRNLDKLTFKFIFGNDEYKVINMMKNLGTL